MQRIAKALFLTCVAVVATVVNPVLASTDAPVLTAPPAPADAGPKDPKVCKLVGEQEAWTISASSPYDAFYRLYLSMMANRSIEKLSTVRKVECDASAS